MVVLSEFFMFLYDVLYESLWWGKVRVCHLIDPQQSVAAYFFWPTIKLCTRDAQTRYIPMACTYHITNPPFYDSWFTPPPKKRCNEKKIVTKCTCKPSNSSQT